MPNTKTQNDREYDAYMREVESFLAKVKKGRRVPSVDPMAPRFSQQADDERLARKAGLGKHIQFGPPTPVFSQVAPPAQPLPQPAPLAQTAPSRVWGFHEPTVTMGEGVEAGLGQVGKVLSDPRNAWIGLGPMAAMGKGAGFFRRVPDLGRDTGGFNVPTSMMRRQDPHMAQLPELWEHERRMDYLFGRRLENDMAEAMQDPTHAAHSDAIDRYKLLMPDERSRVGQVLKGQAELEGEKAKSRNSTTGGSVPPYWFRPR